MRINALAFESSWACKISPVRLKKTVLVLSAVIRPPTTTTPQSRLLLRGAKAAIRASSIFAVSIRNWKTWCSRENPTAMGYVLGGYQYAVHCQLADNPNRNSRTNSRSVLVGKALPIRICTRPQPIARHANGLNSNREFCLLPASFRTSIKQEYLGGTSEYFKNGTVATSPLTWAIVPVCSPKALSRPGDRAIREFWAVNRRKDVAMALVLRRNFW
jgi:hypothetical protein